MWLNVVVKCVVMWFSSDCVSAGAEVAAPHNLAMVTVNTNYVLTWGWDQSAAEGHSVTFTTQYVAWVSLTHTNMIHEGKRQVKWNEF